MQTLARECDYLQSKVTKLEKTNHALVEALENAEFLLRKLSINWKEAASMKDSCANAAEQARAVLALAKPVLG